MNKELKSWLMILCMLIVFVCSSFVSFAWFGDTNEITPKVESGVIRQYFERGSGTEEDPFIIHTPRHLYNLAWLQYLGMFNREIDGEVKQYYFELCADADECEYETGIEGSLDMTGWTLPPIGTAQYPFVGSFNGNGVTISNLTVSGNLNDVSDPALDESTFNAAHYSDSNAGCDIIGVFGVVGNTVSSNYNYNTSKNTVSNVKLDGITVKTETDTSLIGVAAGYVNGAMEDVAVSNSKIVVDDSVRALDGSNLTSNISNYSLVGYCTVAYKDYIYVSQVDVPDTKTLISTHIAGATGAAGGAWNGSIDMKALFDRVRTIQSASSSNAYRSKYVSAETRTYYDFISSIDYTREESTETVAPQVTYRYNNSDHQFYYHTYQNDIEGTYSYMDRSFDNSNTSIFVYMNGGYGSATKVVTNIHYTHEDKDAVLLEQNGAYLSLNNTNIVSTGAFTATKWVVDGGSIYYQPAQPDDSTDDTKYYLHNNNGTLSVTTDEVGGWTVSGDVVKNGDYYLVYDHGTWSLSKDAVYLTDGTHYLNASSTGILATTAVSTDAVWHYDSVNHRFYVRDNGAPYYLQVNQDRVTLTSSAISLNYDATNGVYNNRDDNASLGVSDYATDASLPGSFEVPGTENYRLEEAIDTSAGTYYAIYSNGKILTNDGSGVGTANVGTPSTDVEGASVLTLPGDSDTRNLWSITESNGQYLIRGANSGNYLNLSDAVPTLTAQNSGTVIDITPSDTGAILSNGVFTYTPVLTSVSVNYWDYSSYTNGNYYTDSTGLTVVETIEVENTYWKVNGVRTNTKSNKSLTLYGGIEYNNNINRTYGNGSYYYFDGSSYVQVNAIGRTSWYGNWTINGNNIGQSVNTRIMLYTKTGSTNYLLSNLASTSTTNSNDVIYLYKQYTTVKAYTPDTSLRDNLVNFANSLTASDYTAASWSAMQSELAAANAVSVTANNTDKASASAEQAAINTASQNLKAAILTLVSVKDYLVYNAGWKSTTDVSQSNVSIEEIETNMIDAGTVTILSKTTTVENETTHYPDSTYFPLSTESRTVDGKTYTYAPAQGNTGYVISGKSDNGGDIRISKYPVSNISIYSNNTTVYTRSYKSNGVQSFNAETVVSSGTTLENYGLVKFKDSYSDPENKNEADTFSEILANNPNSVYGLHFMDSQISSTRTIHVNQVEILGDVYHNYELPEDSINFHLAQQGFINFYAGTYYSGNNSFFSLHEVFRNEETKEIESIKEIKKVYGYCENGTLNTDYEYIYQYEEEDGTISYSSNVSAIASETDGFNGISDLKEYSSRINGYAVVFDTGWITNPGNLNGTNRVYYFEVPANAGEYALGSVSIEGRTMNGAYLLYLDLCTNGQVAQRQEIQELMTITEGKYEYPKGVALVANGETISDAGKFALTLKNNSGTTTITKSDESTVTYSSGKGSVTCLSGGMKANGSMLATPISSEVTTIKRVTYVDYNVPKKTTTKTVITWTKTGSGEPVISYTVNVYNSSGDDITSTLTPTTTVATNGDITTVTNTTISTITWSEVCSDKSVILQYAYDAENSDVADNHFDYSQTANIPSTSYTDVPTEVTTEISDKKYEITVESTEDITVIVTLVDSNYSTSEINGNAISAGTKVSVAKSS